MNKELNDLQDIKSAFISHCEELGCDEDYIKVCENKFSDIETTLRDYEKEHKAFEIIKKKQVNVYNFVWYHEHHRWMNYKEYCEILDLPEEEGCDDTYELREFCKCGERLTQEEYDLLKRALL